MHKKFEIYPTKIKGGCQSGRKVVTHNSKSDLPLGSFSKTPEACFFKKNTKTKQILLHLPTYFPQMTLTPLDSKGCPQISPFPWRFPFRQYPLSSYPFFKKTEH